MNDNLEELIDLAVFIKNLNCNSLQFQVLLPNNLNMAERKKFLFWVPQDRLGVLDAMVDKLIEFKKGDTEFIKNSVNNINLIKKYYRGEITSADVQCLSAQKTILVSNQGQCTTCFFPYGSLKNKDLYSILTGFEILKARETVKKCSWPCLLPCFCDGEILKTYNRNA